MVSSSARKGVPPPLILKAHGQAIVEEATEMLEAGLEIDDDCFFEADDDVLQELAQQHALRTGTTGASAGGPAGHDELQAVATDRDLAHQVVDAGV